MSEAEDARRDDGHRLFARALVKKLRAIELLKSRDAATLDPQQQLKLADESRLRAKLAAMGVDAPPSAPPVAPPAAQRTVSRVVRSSGWDIALLAGGYPLSANVPSL